MIGSMAHGAPKTVNSYGQDAFIAPCDDRRRFADFMTRVTDVWLSVYAALRQRIGPDYLHPQWTAPRISECSVNLVSPEFYIEHVLPHAGDGRQRGDGKPEPVPMFKAFHLRHDFRGGQNVIEVAMPAECSHDHAPERC
jgi:hypothetical protein